MAGERERERDRESGELQPETQRQSSGADGALRTSKKAAAFWISTASFLGEMTLRQERYANTRAVPAICARARKVEKMRSVTQGRGNEAAQAGQAEGASAPCGA